MRLPTVDDKTLHDMWQATLVLRGDYRLHDVDIDAEDLVCLIDDLIGALRAAGER